MKMEKRHYLSFFVSCFPSIKFVSCIKNVALRFDSAPSLYLYERKKKDMIKTVIKLNSLDDINEFEKELTKVNADVDASTKNCGYIVDAKSLMGLISLNTTKPITITINADDDSLIEHFRKWMVE